MSRTKNSVAKPRARRPRRLWVVLAGAGLGWALAQLAGALLDGELQTLRFLFIPLSALAGGLAALGAWEWFATVGEAVRGRRLRAALIVLAVGVTLLFGLYLGFSRRIDYGDRSIAYLVGTSRSGLCDCSNDDDASCIQKVGLSPELIRPCWKNRWLVVSPWRSPIF